MALSNLSKKILHRNFDIGKDNASSRGAFHPHLIFFLIERDPFEITLDNEGGEFISIHFGIGDECTGHSSIGDELLLTIQNVIFSVRAEDGRGLRV